MGWDRTIIEYCNDCKRKSVFDINKYQDPLIINGIILRECISCGRYESLDKVEKLNKESEAQ